jgi:hypothetical protein
MRTLLASRRAWFVLRSAKRRIAFLCAFTVVLLGVSAFTAKSQTRSFELYGFLQNNMYFSQEELSAMKSGEVVAKILDTTLTPEVAIFGIARINVTKDFFLQNYGNQVPFIENSSALELGKFSSPPTSSDLKALTLEQIDLEALKNCRPGNCEVKISTKNMEHFQKEIDWSAADHEELAAALFQQMLVEYVQAYLTGGDTALMEYDDKNYPIRLADQYNSLLKESPYLYVYVPELHKYLDQFPRGQLSDVENFIYWLKEDIGAKHPVVSVIHIAAYKPQEYEIDLVVASKQIYASHYFEALLGLTALVNDPEGSVSEFYMLYLSRSRIDSSRKDFNLLRSKIDKQIRRMLEGEMASVKTKMEALYQAK